MKDLELIRSVVGQWELDLWSAPAVFRPNTTSSLLYENLPPIQGLSILDVGCGIGPIAIAAALGGAKKVTAVDVMSEACALTEKNARLANVDKTVEVQNSFALRELGDREFDVIISDISGMSESVARLSPWFPEPIPTGGADGAELAIEVIESARSHLTKNGIMVFPVLSLSSFSLIIETAVRAFPDSLELVCERRIPMHRDLVAHSAVLDGLKKEGAIDFSTRGSRMCWKIWIYHAMAK